MGLEYLWKHWSHKSAGVLKSIAQDVKEHLIQKSYFSFAPRILRRWQSTTNILHAVFLSIRNATMSRPVRFQSSKALLHHPPLWLLPLLDNFSEELCTLTSLQGWMSLFHLEDSNHTFCPLKDNLGHSHMSRYHLGTSLNHGIYIPFQ